MTCETPEGAVLSKRGVVVGRGQTVTQDFTGAGCRDQASTR
jgi:hypothetical protein